MSSSLEIMLAAFAGLLSVPAATLFAQVVLARFRPGRACQPPVASIVPRPSVAVIIPAHNEGEVIADSLRSVKAQLLPGDRLLVVADNCSDNTAAIAHTQGAEVAIRESSERGKGYALDYGIKRLSRHLPEVLIFMDADCVATPLTIERLARLAARSGRPVQAYSRMRAGAANGTAAKIAEFAWVVRNFVRPLGSLSLNLPCQLMGTGMAIPRRLIPRLRLASGHIVEDMRLGVDLAIAGYPPLFCPSAEVTSLFPEEREATETQRTRWEHGHLGMIVSGLPMLLAAAFRQRKAALLALALDLAVPPLALLTLLALATAAAGILGAARFSDAVVSLSVLPAALVGLGVLIAWQGWGQRILSFRDLIAVAPYAAAKIPMYLRFLVKREQRWVKTRRD